MHLQRVPNKFLPFKLFTYLFINSMLPSDLQKKSFLHKFDFFIKLNVGSILRCFYIAPTKGIVLGIRFFVGICLSKKNRQMHSKLLLRNNFRVNSFEQMFPLFSPTIVKFVIISFCKKKPRLVHIYFFRKVRRKHYK